MNTLETTVELIPSDILGQEFVHRLRICLEDRFGVLPLTSQSALNDASLSEGMGRKNPANYRFPWTAAFAFSALVALTEIAVSSTAGVQIQVQLKEGERAAVFSLNKAATPDLFTRFYIDQGGDADELRTLLQTHDKTDLAEIVQQVQAAK